MDQAQAPLPPPPRLPPVEPPRESRSGRSRLGAAVAVVALVGALALVVAAVASIPPFRSATPSPTVLPTAAPSPVATSSAGPSASPTPASAADIRAALTEIEGRMADIRGLSAGQPLDPKLLSSADAAKLLIDDFHAENPTDFIDAQTRLYRALGLLGSDQDLAKLYQSFLSTQVLGFYRDSDKSLYIVSDQAFGPLQQLTAAHEYTHALQDAHFGLKDLQPKGHDQGDLSLARVALPEGDATLAMTQWAIADLSPDELSQLAQQLQDPIALQALADIPPIVRDTEEFPYSDGLAFVQRAWATGGWSAVDNLWQRPPDTTEQVLHPEKYDAKEAAVPVALPAGIAADLGSGWKMALEDTHGELVTRIWLEEALDSATATTDAAGWGGDRIGYYEGPNGAWAVVWLSAWDSMTDAQEFSTAAEQVRAKLPHAVVYGNGARSVGVFVASDEKLLLPLASSAGFGPD